jgi:hypothetical protein
LSTGYEQNDPRGFCRQSWGYIPDYDDKVLTWIAFTDRKVIRTEVVVLSGLKIVAIILIVAGVAGLVAGQFTYTKATHEAKLGPIDLSLKEKKTVNIPLWAGIAAIVAGGLLLVVPKRT